MCSDSGRFAVIEDLDIDNQSLERVTAVVSEDNRLLFVVCNVVVGGEDKLGAALRVLGWAFDLEVERVVLRAFVLELPAIALTVTSTPVARHLQLGRVAVLETQEVVGVVSVGDDELGLGSHLGGDDGGNSGKGELFVHC